MFRIPRHLNLLMLLRLLTTSDNALISVDFRDWKHAKGKNGTLTYHDSLCSKHCEAFLPWRKYRFTIAKNNSVAVHVNK